MGQVAVRAVFDILFSIIMYACMYVCMYFFFLFFFFSTVVSIHLERITNLRL